MPSLSDGRRRLATIVLVLGGVAASAVAAVQVGTAPGMYVAEAEVVVHPPRIDTANPLATESQDAIRFAALVADAATDGVEVPRVTNQNLTLADQGMKHATVISLVNLGGQWANDFSRPFIRVEAVDSTAGAVENRVRAGIDQVIQTMDRLQRGAGVLPTLWASTEVVPAAPQITYEPTHRHQAMAATFVVGLLFTGMLRRFVVRGAGAIGGRRLRDRESPRRGRTPRELAGVRPGHDLMGQE